jgi:hypothetical protein
LGLGGSNVRSGNESSLAQTLFFTVKTYLVSEEGVTYSHVSVAIILRVFQFSTCFVLRNYKFMAMFLWQEVIAVIYLFIYT